MCLAYVKIVCFVFCLIFFSEAEINRKTVVVTAILTLVGILVLLKTQTQYGMKVQG